MRLDLGSDWQAYRDRAIEFLRYNPTTGVLVWRRSPSNSAPKDRAGYVNKASGYRQIKLANRMWQEHRLIFLCYYGWLPKMIDHKNGDKQDNRISNLRPATSTLNNRNKRVEKNKSSGLPVGVFFSRSPKNPYLAQIGGAGKDGGCKHLGHFPTIAAASLAYLAAKAVYHPEVSQ